MNFEKTVIAGLNYHLPEKTITSSEIEDHLMPLYERLKLPYGRLELMTGIKKRHIWPKGTRPSQIASRAAQQLLEQTSFPREEIDLLIHASVCRDFLEPSTASVIHSHLKLSPKSMIFDLSNACLGVLNAMVVAAHMIEREQIQSALIVSGENGGPLILDTIDSLLKNTNLTRKDLKKYIASLTIGSAATAILLTHKNFDPNKTYPQMVGGAITTDSEAHHLCQGDGGTHSLTMETDSETLLKKGVQLAISNFRDTQQNLKWNHEQIDWVISHQVGSAHEKQVLEALGLKQKKTFITYPDFGNTGSSALPLTLAKLMEQKERPQKGEKVILLGIGSGLTSLMLGIQI